MDSQDAGPLGHLNITDFIPLEELYEDLQAQYAEAMGTIKGLRRTMREVAGEMRAYPHGNVSSWADRLDGEGE